ncbi:MAG: aminoglycoside phosphotransferase family protein [Bacteroidota bacterium]
MNVDHIQSLSQFVFGQHPSYVEKKTIGICNEVYEIGLKSGPVILRMNTQKDLLYGTHKFLPLFKELGIKTPDILADDYTQDDFPFCYQFLTKLEGKDLGIVMEQLSSENLKGIAAEISDIFDKFNTLPYQKSFGGIRGVSEEHLPSYWHIIQNKREGLLKATIEKKVIEHRSFDILDELIGRYEAYFKELKPRLFYDDICSKNVMIHEGQFMGLVDLDFMSKGDYLEAIGTILASYHGTAYGRVYLDEIIKLQGLNDFHRQIVHFYAILHLIGWTSEAGRVFNSNTTGVINWERVKRNNQAVKEIYEQM